MTALLLALLVPVSARAAGLRPESEKMPAALIKEVARREEPLRATLTGRRLLAETENVARRAALTGLPRGAVVAYRREPERALAYDEGLVPRAEAAAFELAYVRELAKAAMDIPVEIPETEMAAREQELFFVLEKCELDPAFDKEMRSGFAAAGKELDIDSRRGDDPPAPPAGELKRAAFDLALFSRDPNRFYWVVERDTPHGSTAVRLSTLEDFTARYGPKFEGEELPGTPYARVKGRRVSSALWEAARKAAASGGLSRIKEALGDFEGGLAQELQKRILKRFTPEALLDKPKRQRLRLNDPSH